MTDQLSQCSLLPDQLLVEGLQLRIPLDLPPKDVLKSLRVRPLENGVLALDLVAGLVHAQGNQREVGSVDVDQLQKHLDLSTAPLVRGLRGLPVPPFLGLQRDLVDQVEESVVVDLCGGLLLDAVTRGRDRGYGLVALLLKQNSELISHNSEHNSGHNSDRCSTSSLKNDYMVRTQLYLNSAKYRPPDV